MELIEEPRTLQRLAETLAAGLSQEQAAVQALRATVEEQIQALHKQDRDGVEDTTLQTSQEIHTLDRLREERARNIETLIEYLGLQEQASDLQSIIPALEEKLQAPQLIEQLNALRETIPAEVESTREKCRQLAYSLQYALHLGHSIIEAVQGAGNPPPIQIYTTAGEKKLPANRRIMVNKVG